MRVGFIGVGDQGGPMADAIMEGGFELHIWARRPEVQADYVARGAVGHSSPAALAADVDQLGLCVVSEADVRELLFDKGIFDAMHPGGLIALHSTMSPVACRELEGEARTRGLKLIDAPVSGARAGAIARKLLVLVGGEDDAVAEARPMLGSYGDRVVHLGPVGAGQTSKILNNLLLNANMAAAEFVLEFGGALGLDRARLREVMLQGTSRSYALDVIDTVIFPGKLAPTLGRKDIGLAMELAAAAGIKRKSLDLVAELGLLGRDRLAGGPVT